MIRIAALIVLILASVPAHAEPETGFATPSPSMLERLRSQNEGHGWLRVTLDSTRFDLRARQIDERGLSGLKPRGRDRRRFEAYISSPSSAGHLAWSSISRIDQRPLSRSGRIAGIITGGLAGAAIPPYVVGALAGAVAGSWLGGQIGDRFVRPHRWYVGQPMPAPPALVVETPVEVAPPRPDSAVANVATSPAPSDSAVAIAPPSTPPSQNTLAAVPPAVSAETVPGPPSREVLRAYKRIQSDDLVRFEADFGEFQGYASQVGPQGLAGLHADLRAQSSAPPSSLVTWDRIHWLEKRGGSAGRGAIGGAVVVGGVGLGLGILVVLIATGFGGDVDAASVVGVIGAGTLGGAALGAGIGALIGAPIPRWHVVYQRPGPHRRSTQD